MSRQVFRSKWKTKDVVLFLERLELYLSSGLSLNSAVALCAHGLNDSKKSDVTKMTTAIESGERLSKCLRKYLRVNSSSISLIDHGESTGNLVQSISMSRKMLESGDNIKRKCISAMIYPAVIATFSGLLTIALMRVVMPQIIPMLNGLHVQLPIITRIVILISESLGKYGLYIACTIFVASITGTFALKRSHKLRRILHATLNRVPILGKIIYTYHLSIFLASTGYQIESGLPVGKTYLEAVESVTFTPLKDDLSQDINKISRGLAMGQAFGKKKMPAFIKALLIAGESSGSLGSSAVRSSAILEKDVDQLLKGLTSLIEPIMMVGMGGIVGSIALSIMLPIYDISKVLQK